MAANQRTAPDMTGQRFGRWTVLERARLTLPPVGCPVETQRGVLRALFSRAGFPGDCYSL
jgi:hypothetical protein